MCVQTRKQIMTMRKRRRHHVAPKPGSPIMSATMHSDPVISGIDPFSAAFSADLYAFHHRLRDAGPVVWLEKYGVWGMARYAEVHAALNNWQTFMSGAGAGIHDLRKERAWRPPSIVLEADP